MKHDLLLAGVDGGGTKTECLVCDADGNVLGRGRAGASNPNGQSIEAAAGALCEAVALALDGLEGCVTLYAGIAGCVSPERSAPLWEALERRFPGIRAVVGSDARIGLSSMIGSERDGVIAISGTGSSCFARRSGKLLRIGGWGYLFGDMGSGYELGRMALMRTMREKDGLAQGSALSRLCEEKLGAPVEERLAALYDGGRTYIASFATCVSAAMAEGDAAAREIIEENANGIAERIAAALRLLEEPAAPVVLTGTLWKALQGYRERVGALLPGAVLIDADRPPVVGAIREAAALAGIDWKKSTLLAD